MKRRKKSPQVSFSSRLNFVYFVFHLPLRRYVHVQIKNLPNRANYEATEDTLMKSKHYKVTEEGFNFKDFFFRENGICLHYSRENVGFHGYYEVLNNTLILICLFLMNLRNLHFLPFLQSI